MSWLRVDDKFPRHGKVAPLTDPAFRMHVHAMAHCAEHETDGFLDDATFETLTRHKNKAAIAKELEGARGFRKDGEPLWKRVEGGWEIHDYLQWNPSHAELEAKRLSAKVRMSGVRSREHNANAQRTSSSGSEEPVSTPYARARGSGSGSESQISEGSVEGSPPAVAESGFDLALRVWSELWGKAYRQVYQVPLDHSPTGDERILQRLGAMAAARGAQADTVLRHKAAIYLAKTDAFYADKQHPLRFLERDWNAWGEPAKRAAAPAEWQDDDDRDLPSPAVAARLAQEAVHAAGGAKP